MRNTEAQITSVTQSLYVLWLIGSGLSKSGGWGGMPVIKWPRFMKLSDHTPLLYMNLCNKLKVTRGPIVSGSSEACSPPPPLTASCIIKQVWSKISQSPP